jgi:predicted metal-dependent peptidase
MNNSEKNLAKPVYQLLKSAPFYAHFLLGCKVVYDHKDVKTAAVRIVKGEIEFMINTEWYFSKPLLHQTNVIKHEVFHVLLEHCGVRSSQHDRQNHAAINIAMDCAINQHLGELPESRVTLKFVEDFCKRKLNPFDTWEYYWENMKKAAKEQGKMVPGEGQPHDHDHMLGDDGEDTEAAREMRKAAVKDAASKAMAASHGNVPQEIQKLLGQLNKEAKIPWKQQLRNFVASSRSVKKKSTRMKAHRRFELEQPGKKKDREFVLAVCTDSSGSVSDEAYASFMTEIYTIAKSTTITYLIHADCVVQKVDIIKGGKAKEGVLTTRHGSGGTAYQPAIDEAMKRKVDAILYFGDFDSSDVPRDPGVPFLWVGVGSQKPPGSFGRVLRL